MSAEPVEEVVEPRGMMLPPDFDWTLLFPAEDVDTSWMDYALCVETDPEAFFPGKHEKADAAKAICRRCEVQDECLTYALTIREREGVWGGESSRARRKMRGDLIREALGEEPVIETAAEEAAS